MQNFFTYKLVPSFLARSVNVIKVLIFGEICKFFRDLFSRICVGKLISVICLLKFSVFVRLLQSFLQLF